MALHPALVEDVRLRSALPEIEDVGADVIRARVEAFAIGMRVPRPDVAEVFDQALDASEGQLRVRCYVPGQRSDYPLVIFIHGGGFVHSSIDTHDWLCRHLCMGADATVVSVHYRRAPEHRFPAALDDCVAATRWAMGQARRLRIEPSRAALVGDSAGGNLAAATALRLRDDGAAPLQGQVLFYPCLGGHLLGLKSHTTYASGFGLTRSNCDWFWAQYLGPGLQPPAYAVPLMGTDFSNLPPALIITAECDLLRDDGDEYACRLISAGISVTSHRVAEMNHGFLFRADIVPDSMRAIRLTNRWLRNQFAIP